MYFDGILERDLVAAFDPFLPLRVQFEHQFAGTLQLAAGDVRLQSTAAVEAA